MAPNKRADCPIHSRRRFIGDQHSCFTGVLAVLWRLFIGSSVDFRELLLEVQRLYVGGAAGDFYWYPASSITIFIEASIDTCFLIMVASRR